MEIDGKLKMQYKKYIKPFVCSVHFIPDSIKPEPTIQAQRKVYIQWRKGKKLQLLVGGYGYLLPWTTVVLRCPTRHFRKGHVRWLKEGRPLAGRPHLSITPQGYVKIQQVRASDIGIYTCVAGQAQEHFVLQIIGSKQKLSVPESWLLTDRQQKVGQPDVASTGERFQELPISLNRYDSIVERLLLLKGSVQDEKDITGKPHSSEKNRSTLEDERASAEFSSPVVLIADTHRLDEIMLNLSEGLGGAREEQLIAQLLSELTMTQGESNDSTLHPPESAESATQGPLLYKPKVLTTRQRNPVMIQRPRKAGPVPSSEMVVHIGVPALLQKPVASLELRCEALGNPEPSLTWTKNGKELMFNSRLVLPFIVVVCAKDIPKK